MPPSPRPRRLLHIAGTKPPPPHRRHKSRAASRVHAPGRVWWARRGRGRAAERRDSAGARQVLELVGDGLLNKEIAARLGITLRYVEKIIQRLLEKTETHNRTQLVRRGEAAARLGRRDPHTSAASQAGAAWRWPVGRLTLPDLT